MTVALVIAAFVAMEPFTYAAHRFVMHGPGMRLHRSHHRRWPARREGDAFLEANDAFPVVFAAATMLALAFAFNVGGLSVLGPVCVGTTLYGVAYGFVHDVYIHRRLGGIRRVEVLDRLAEAHALHHRFGGEPFGMLMPIVPASVRRQAQELDEHRARSASGQRVGAAPRP